MESAAYQIRIFLEGREIHSATCPNGTRPRAGDVMDAIGSQWRVLKAENKLSSGDFDRKYDELWVDVERI